MHYLTSLACLLMLIIALSNVNECTLIPLILSFAQHLLNIYIFVK